MLTLHLFSMQQSSSIGFDYLRRTSYNPLDKAYETFGHWGHLKVDGPREIVSNYCWKDKGEGDQRDEEEEEQRHETPRVRVEPQKCMSYTLDAHI